MRLRACTLMGFGKFYRKSIAFGDGLHVIYGENEAGKTTLKTFLVAMLFGLDKKRGQAAKKDEYHKYLPYMGGIYGGSLDCSHEGHRYQIQRTFTTQQDITIYDLDTGRKLFEGREPGECLFSITKEGFLQTLCVSQGEILTGPMLTSMLRNYMANMSHTKSKDVNVEKALTWLRREIRKEKKHPAYAEVDRLHMELKNAADQAGRITRLKKQREEILESLEEEKEQGIWFRFLQWIRRLFGFVSQDELRRQELSGQLETIEVRLESLYEDQEKTTLLREKLDEAKKEVQKSEENIRYIHRAMEAITKASEEIHEAFGNGLEERVSTIMSEITDGTYKKIRIDDTMGIVVEKDGAFLDINYLSTGTVEQIYLAVRIAAAEFMYEREDFPIILDDVFGNFDDERLRRILAFLEKEQRQVLLFTCRKDIISMLDRNGHRYEKTVLA